MVIPTGRLPDNEPAELLKEEFFIEASVLEDWMTTDFWAGYNDEEEPMIEEFDWAA